MPDISRFEVPIAQDLKKEMNELWHETLEKPLNAMAAELAGKELDHNRLIFYLTRQGEALAGTTSITIPVANPDLGGLGEVATEPEFRRRGIAYRLCERARDEFREAGGKAIFLATGNGVARRVYARLRWQRLANANVMACIAGGASAEEFMVDYFGQPADATVRPASAAERVPMIPLLINPHDWQVLDANVVGMHSTRQVLQNSCMGLYTRYTKAITAGKGTWFCARTSDGRLVGLSTVCLDDEGGCCVDGFAHRNFMEVWEDLIQAAAGWGANQGAKVTRALLAVEDEDKRAHFESLGFREVGKGEGFDFRGLSKPSLRFER